MKRTWANKPAAGKAGIASRLAIGHLCPGLPEPGRSPMQIRRPHFLWLTLAAVVALAASAVEPDYHQRFSETLSNGQTGFIHGTDLVDTNNWGPSLTNATIAFAKFRDGELGGIRLGMTMAEVVAAWGKPRSLCSHCRIGPRFWYGDGPFFGDLSLSFKGDRLVLIGICGGTAKHVTFDNGLSGHAGRSEYEKILGEPSLRDTVDLGLFNGEIAYRSGAVLATFTFKRVSAATNTEHLGWAAVCLEAEAQRDRSGEPGGAASGNQPSLSETNSTPSAAGSRR